MFERLGSLLSGSTRTEYSVRHGFYSHHKDTVLSFPPPPAPFPVLQFTTLSGIVNYCKNDPDEIMMGDDPFVKFIVVTDPGRVQVCSALNWIHKSRSIYAEAYLSDGYGSLDQWKTRGDFCHAMAQFDPCANTRFQKRDEQEHSAVVELSPWRTFPEIEPQVAEFLFEWRVLNTEVQYRLRELDALSWKVHAIAAIVKYLKDALPEMCILS